WRSAARFRGESQVTTWLYRITVNASLTAIKKTARWGRWKTNAPTAEQTSFCHPNTPAKDREENQELYAAIATLPGRQKSAIILSYVEGLPRQQVADAMGLSLKAVESLLMRGKKSLRQSLQKTYPNRG
ncbi:MAG: sigma-70 family RNA polymerase sigma factor, partial [Bacteroidota bacterium]